MMIIVEKLAAIAENEKKVYDAGSKKGYSDGYNAGFFHGREQNVEYSDGVSSERQRFWNRYLHGGGRQEAWASQTGLFNGRNFGFDNFYPTCDIKPVGDASYLFYDWSNSYADSKGSLKQRLEECGVVLDTSKATKLSFAFAFGSINEIPTLDCRGLGTDTKGLFQDNYSKLKTIEKLIVNEDVTFVQWFLRTDVQEIRFEGWIGQDLDLSYQSYNSSLSKLSGESIINVIAHLSDTAEGKTLTLSQTAVDKAISDGYFDGGVSIAPGTISGGGDFYSNPISLKAGDRLKVELVVSDDHFDLTATYDETKYGYYMDDPQFWGVSLYNEEADRWTPQYRNYIYTATEDQNYVIKSFFRQYTIDSTTPNAIFAIRAVLVDENGNEITGENRYSAVEIRGISNVDSWDAFESSKSNWTIALV